MIVKRLSHVSLGSKNLLETELFYTQVLGCEVAHEFRNPAGERYGFFLHVGDGTFLEFFQNQDARPEPGLFRHLCFEVANIDAFAEHARSKGYERIVIKRGRTDRILQCFIHDPDGNQVEIQQHDDESALAPYIKKESVAG